MNGYDPDVFDCEILLDRMPNSRYTTQWLMDYFGFTNIRTFYSHIRRGSIPEAAIKKEGFAASQEWSRRQVIGIMLNPPPRSDTGGRAALPREHGTRRGADQHRKYGEPICDDCREGERRRAREQRAAKKVA